LFISLINDLFPNIKLEKENYAELEAAIDKEAQAAGLICHPPWILKIIQVKFIRFLILRFYFRIILVI
jgi:dynein heavy chain